MLARRRQSSKLCRGRAVVLPGGLWMVPLACLHNGREPRSFFSNRGFEPLWNAPSAVRDAERMSNVFDIYTIIFLALAVFIFLRLRRVLGQRTGGERPPYDRAARNVVQGAPDSTV